MSLRRDFVGLLIARGLKLAVGLATIFVYARMFGVSATYDGWIWSLGVVNAVILMVFGPITETIRASYTAIDHKEGRAAAEEYIATVAVIMIGGASLLAFIASACFPMLAKFSYAGSADQAETATFFLYVLAPSLLVSQAVAILTAHLNCRGSFFPPEIAGIIGGAGGVLFIVMFPNLPALWVLPISYYIGLAAPLVVGASFWPALLHSVLRLNRAAFRRHGVGALAFSTPLLLPYALGQLSGLIERQYALLAGTGVLAVLSYSLFARNTVQAVFSSAISSLAIPSLTRQWDPADTAPFWDDIRHWIHQCLTVLTMGMMVMFGLAGLVPAILFRADIGAEAQALLTTLLHCYAIALISVIIYLVGGAALLGARKGKTYAILGAGCGAVSTLLVIVLFPYLGVVGIPIALGVSHAGAGWLMFSTFGRAGAWWIIRRAAICALITGTGGTVIRYVDQAAHDLGFTVFGRLAIDLAASAILCGLIWLGARRHGYVRVASFAVSGD